MKGDIIYAIREPLGLREHLHNINSPFSGIILQQLSDGLFTFRHYGIDVGDGSVIHFTGEKILIDSNAAIQQTSMKVFLKGSKKYVDVLAKLKNDRNAIISEAEKYLGLDFNGYNFFKNNCEHFAFFCGTGKRTSRQVCFKNDDQDIVEKAIDRTFEPLLRLGDKIDSIFGWGRHK